MGKWLKLLVVLLFVAAIGFGGYKGYAVNKAVKQSNERAVVSFESMNSSTMGSYGLTGDNNIKNILLVGADKRGSETGYGRSDCMMIASIDSKNSQLKMTSLLGDTYVDIPGYGENRLSMAYSIGGISLLYQAIAANYGIRLDQYAVVEFKDFVNIIDKLGGVSINVTEFEASYLQYYYNDNVVNQVAIGENILNGTQALAYVRIKQDAAGDFGRTTRERKIMKALFSKLTGTSVSNLVSTLETLLDSMTTDITPDIMKNYLAEVLKLSSNGIRERILPDDDEYVAQVLEGTTIYRVDPQICKESIADFIFNPVQQKDMEASTAEDAAANNLE